MFKGNCYICKRPITDASGCWRLGATDFGINHNMPEYITTCSNCKNLITETIKELAKEKEHD